MRDQVAALQALAGPDYDVHRLEDHVMLMSKTGLESFCLSPGILEHPSNLYLEIAEKVLSHSRPAAT